MTSGVEKTISFLNSLSDRKFGIRIETDSFNLYPRLVHSLNSLSVNLKSEFSSLTKNRNELLAVLGAMTEGVVLVSGKGKIKLINRSAKKMFQIKKEKVDNFYWELIRDRELNDLIQRVFESKRSVTDEISLYYPEERFYRVNIITIDDSSSDIIVVLFDITEFRKLERIKADFIANVSHELRTPLTSIKGYIETIRDGAYSGEDEKDRFLDTIDKNADRLINIVSDLLVLSEIESKEPFYSPETIKDFEEINIGNIIDQSVVSLEGKITEKTINCSVETDEDLPLYKGNKFLLEQMVSNLVDNAIKYTPCKGEIAVKARSGEGEIIIEVSDTGIGIPAEDQSRIFERFYRVDKNRSRKIGGTGLGLSIVKHIVLLHGGSINVESVLKKGTTFTVKLPLAPGKKRN